MPPPEVELLLRWAAELGQWAIPPEILAGAPTSPWTCEPADFAVETANAADAHSTATPSTDVERAVLPLGGSVLDVGCGGGRASLALVPPAELVIGVDESAAMLDAFTTSAARSGLRALTNHGRWPDVAAAAPAADLVVCHHVAYNVPDIGPFLAALTDHARLAVVLELTDRHPQSAWNEAWLHFWGLERPSGPTADDLVRIVRRLGWAPEVWRHRRPAADGPFQDRERAVRSTLRRLCLPVDRAPEVAEFLDAHPLRWPSDIVTLRWPGSDDR